MKIRKNTEILNTKMEFQIISKGRTKTCRKSQFAHAWSIVSIMLRYNCYVESSSPYIIIFYIILYQEGAFTSENYIAAVFKIKI